MRRILVSKDMLYFSRMTENVAIDTIPLHEILGVTEMSDELGLRRESTVGSTGPANINAKKFVLGVNINSANDFRSPSTEGPGRQHLDFARENYDRLFQIKTDPEGFNSGTFFGVESLLRARVLITMGHLTASRQNLLSAGSFSSGTAVDPRES